MSDKLACPTCGTLESRVIDIRGCTRSGLIDTPYVRRQRECTNGHRYSTRELPIEWVERICAENEALRRLRDFAKKVAEGDNLE